MNDEKVTADAGAKTAGKPGAKMPLKLQKELARLARDTKTPISKVAFQGYPVDTMLSRSRTALHWAVAARNTVAVESLLTLGADPHHCPLSSLPGVLFMTVGDDTAYEALVAGMREFSYAWNEHLPTPEEVATRLADRLAETKVLKKGERLRGSRARKMLLAPSRLAQVQRAPR
jgi:hypothetical protein